jgi:phage terminase large subunit
MILKLDTTEVFEKIMAAKVQAINEEGKLLVDGRSGKPIFVPPRNIVNEGGTRSSKTVSELQYFVMDAFNTKTPKEYDIIRETLPALKATAMKDFEDIILKPNGLYSEANHNMSENIYTVNGSHFNFYSAKNNQGTESMKLRGRKRNKILMNEANEMSLDTYRQVAMRTTEQILLDYNPSEEDSWIYDHIIPRRDTVLIQSTYLDNPFLEQAIINDIEYMKVDDPEYWMIYGLGLRGKRSGLVYPKYRIVPEFPEDCREILYGIDFGFNDPKVLVKLGRMGRSIFIQQLLYRSGMLRDEFIEQLKKFIPEEKRDQEMYADSADPESIEAIYQAGFNIMPADKSKDSVMFGIETVRGYDICITADSVDVQKDFKNYKFKKDKNGKLLDVPIHSFSHSPDAVRYPVYTHWGKESRFMSVEDARTAQFEVRASEKITYGYQSREQVQRIEVDNEEDYVPFSQPSESSQVNY